MEARPSSICITCYGIKYQQMGNHENWLRKCIICADFHKMEDHLCGVTGSKKRKEKIWLHFTPKYVNSTEFFATDSPRYKSRHKVKINARKEKKIKANQKWIVQACSTDIGAEKKRKEASAHLYI